MQVNNKLWLFEITLEEAYKIYEEQNIYFELGKSSIQLKAPYDDTNLFVITKKEEKEE